MAILAMMEGTKVGSNCSFPQLNFANPFQLPVLRGVCFLAFSLSDFICFYLRDTFGRFYLIFRFFFLVHSCPTTHGIF